MSLNKLAIHDKILIAGVDLHERGHSPFSAEDLVVASWKLYPDAFSLAGYDLPNSNRVFAEIMGTKPLRKQGLLRKVGEKLYVVTEAGLIKRQSLHAVSTGQGAKKFNFGRDISYKTRRLLESRAVDKFKNGRLDDISFNDACLFWGLTPRSTAIECEGAFSNLTQVLVAATDAVGDVAKRFTHDGPLIAKADIHRLVEVHDYLKAKFKRDLDIILTRTDER